ncbi:hypothetical protein [Streptomyces sp. NPDC001135]
MTGLETALVGLGGALGGAFLGAAANHMFTIRRERRRDQETGLQAQRQAVRKQFKRAYAAKDWVARLPQSINVSDSPERRQEIQDEAIRRSTDCHTTWDISHMGIDSDEVRQAMARLDQQVVAVLGQVAQGDFSPDLNLLRQSLKELTAAAERRLTTDLR